MSTIISYASTKFGEFWDKSLFDLVQEAAEGALASAKISIGQVDAIFFGNMMAGILENNLHSGAKIAELLGTHVPVFRLEAACASGGIAFQMAHTYLQANSNKTVLVLGAEKMTDVPVARITQALSAAASGEEQAVGLTFPGLYGMLARFYCDKYGYSEEHMAAIPVKNHFHALHNEKAQFRKEISIENVMSSPYVASPLKVLDSSPITDGAAALVLTNNADYISKAPMKASVRSTAMATDTLALKSRAHFDRLEATEIAAKKAFAGAKISPAEVQVAEVHDCFSIAELLAMEDLGFWKKGEAGRRASQFETRLGSGGSLFVNTSGGLKASGHPVGATGIKQIGELFQQLTGQAGKRQVKGVHYGLAHNVGGSGGTAVVTILGSI